MNWTRTGTTDWFFFVPALKAFVQEAENELDAGCDVVGKFLAAGRSPEDILRAVNTTEKKNLTVPTLVFSAVRLIIMR